MKLTLATVDRHAAPAERTPSADHEQRLFSLEQCVGTLTQQVNRLRLDVDGLLRWQAQGARRPG